MVQFEPSLELLIGLQSRLCYYLSKIEGFANYVWSVQTHLLFFDWDEILKARFCERLREMITLKNLESLLLSWNFPTDLVRLRIQCCQILD